MLNLTAGLGLNTSNWGSGRSSISFQCTVLAAIDRVALSFSEFQEFRIRLRRQMPFMRLLSLL